MKYDITKATCIQPCDTAT